MTKTSAQSAKRACAGTAVAKKSSLTSADLVRTRKARPVEKPWANQYLEDRAVDAEFAQANNAELHGDHIVFVKHHPLTHARMDSSRTRHKVPPLDKDGRPMKFTQRRAEAFPYFPVHWDWSRIFKDPAVDLFIVESETSALAGAQRGLPVIGVGGCDGVFMAGARRQKLHPIFSEVVLKNRRIFLVFDADSRSNKNVHDAEQAAAKLFAEAVR
jgi:hypothetical protein